MISQFAFIGLIVGFFAINELIPGAPATTMPLAQATIRKSPAPKITTGLVADLYRCREKSQLIGVGVDLRERAMDYLLLSASNTGRTTHGIKTFRT
jgi:hypothetical protein